MSSQERTLTAGSSRTAGVPGRPAPGPPPRSAGPGPCVRSGGPGPGPSGPRPRPRQIAPPGRRRRPGRAERSGDWPGPHPAKAPGHSPAARGRRRDRPEPPTDVRRVLDRVDERQVDLPVEQRGATSSFETRKRTRPSERTRRGSAQRTPSTRTSAGRPTADRLNRRRAGRFVKRVPGQRPLLECGSAGSAIRQAFSVAPEGTPTADDGARRISCLTRPPREHRIGLLDNSCRCSNPCTGWHPAGTQVAEWRPSEWVLRNFPSQGPRKPFREAC